MIPTVKIKVTPCDGNPEGVVLINEAEFDPAVHTRYEPEGKSSGESSAGNGKGKGKGKSSGDASAESTGA